VVTHRWDHHPPCPGGCNNLADECACPRPNPLGSMRIVEPIGSSPAPGRYCMPKGTCYCGECDHYVPQRRHDERETEPREGQAHVIHLPEPRTT